MAAALAQPVVTKVFCVPIISGSPYLAIERYGYVTQETKTVIKPDGELIGFYHDLSCKYVAPQVGQIASIYKGEHDIKHIRITAISGTEVSYLPTGVSKTVTETWDNALIKSKRIFLGCWMV